MPGGREVNKEQLHGNELATGPWSGSLMQQASTLQLAGTGPPTRRHSSCSSSTPSHRGQNGPVLCWSDVPGMLVFLDGAEKGLQVQ